MKQLLFMTSLLCWMVGYWLLDSHQATQAQTIIPSITALFRSSSVSIVAQTTRAAIKTPTPKPSNNLETCSSEQCFLQGHFLLDAPISTEGNRKPDATYRYGYTQKYKRPLHHGIDLKNELDIPVLAAEEGIVIVAGKDNERAYAPQTNFYGQLVVLRHDLPTLEKTLYTLYGHLNQVTVKLGQKVKMGQKIGTVGMSGIAIGYHLHFEVRYGKNDYDSTRNPELWLHSPLNELGQPTGVLSGRIVNSQGQPMRIAKIVLTRKEAASGEMPIYLGTYDDSPIPHDGGAGDDSYLMPFETRSLGRDDVLDEDFTISGLTPGIYTFAFTSNKVYSLQIEIFPEKLTFLHIVADS